MQTKTKLKKADNDNSFFIFDSSKPIVVVAYSKLNSAVAACR